MISRKSDKNFLVTHWDKLVAVAGLLVLGLAGYMAADVLSKDPAESAQEVLDQLVKRTATSNGVEAVSMDAYKLVTDSLKTANKIPELPETQESFMASGRRVFCQQADANAEKKCCGRPIPFGSKVCPFCALPQHEAEKPVLDSDGDGFPDDYEKAHGMNYLDPNDGAEDNDKDGFTNQEEFDAGTDPADAKSHPDYLDSLRIQLPLKETLLPFYFEKVAPTPSGRRYYFKALHGHTSWTSGTKSVSVLEGEEIGKLGFVVTGYNEKTRKEKIKGSVNYRQIDCSEATIKRKSDGKQFVLPIEQRRISLDTQATLVYERHGTLEFVVVPGDEIELNGSKYRVADIARKGKGAKVTVVDLSTAKSRVLEALE